MKKKTKTKKNDAIKGFVEINFWFLEASFGIAFTVLIHDKNI